MLYKSVVGGILAERECSELNNNLGGIVESTDDGRSGAVRQHHILDTTIVFHLIAEGYRK